MSIFGEDPSNYYSQMVFFATGLVIMFAVALFDIDYLSRFDRCFYVVNILLLVAVILVGSSSNNAVRWIKIGPVKTSAVGIFQGHYDLLYGEFY